MLAGVRRFFVGLALVAAIGVPVYFLTAALGTKFGLLDWRVGFGLMVFQWGPIVLGAGGVIGLVATILAFTVRPGGGRIAALVALVVPLALMGWFASLASAGMKVPPIHDISTDLADPPQFSRAILEARAQTPGVNSLDAVIVPEGVKARFPDAAGKPVAELQREAYPGLAPIVLTAAPDVAFDEALAIINAQGWAVVTQDKASGLIEATAESFWFGFKDDIAVRIRPEPTGGSVVDIRSVSRVGLSDLGANAKRIEMLSASLGGGS